MTQLREVTDQPVRRTPEDRLSFEDFTLLLSELQARRSGRSGRQSPSVLSRTAEMLLTPLTRVAEWVLPQRLARQLSNGNGAAQTADQRDVYLGGTLTNTSWRENIAIPILK